MAAAASLPIGDFSRATHMSVKALRYYHRVGLLEPADVDRFTGHRRYTTEQIIGLLREAEVRLGQGQAIGTICRGFGISEQSYYRWRREYGGLKLDQAKRLKELEQENSRLKRAVSELTLDKLVLKEAFGGKY